MITRVIFALIFIPWIWVARPIRSYIIQNVTLEVWSEGWNEDAINLSNSWIAKGNLNGPATPILYAEICREMVINGEPYLEDPIICITVPANGYRSVEMTGPELPTIGWDIHMWLNRVIPVN